MGVGKVVEPQHLAVAPQRLVPLAARVVAHPLPQPAERLERAVLRPLLGDTRYKKWWTATKKLLVKEPWRSVLAHAGQLPPQADKARAVRGRPQPILDMWEVDSRLCGRVRFKYHEDLPEIDTVLIPLSGGGLAAGIALVLKAARPAVRVIGISMERGPAMYHSLRAGRPVQVTEEESLADSLGGGIGLDNTYTYAMVRDLVDEVVLVGEDEIAAAMRHAYWEERQIAEGGGSVGIAVLLAGRVGRPGGHTVCLLSGRNVDMTAFTRIVAGPAAGDDRPSKGGRAA